MPVVREDVADYLGEVQAFDAAVGVLLDELEKTGELENTLIFMSGDHGIPGMPHGKCNLYDLGVGVSLAVRWGKKIPAQRVVDDFVCLSDLCPTILEAAGETPPAAMTARSLLGVLTSSKSGTVDPTRDAVIVGRERHVAARSRGQLALSLAGDPHGRFSLHPQLSSRALADGRRPRLRQTARTVPRGLEHWPVIRWSHLPTWTPARRKPG